MQLHLNAGIKKEDINMTDSEKLKAAILKADEQRKKEREKEIARYKKAKDAEKAKAEKAKKGVKK